MDYIPDPNQPGAASIANQLLNSVAQRGPEPFDTARAPSEQLRFSPSEQPKLVALSSQGNQLTVAWQGYESGQPTCVMLTRLLRVNTDPRGAYVTLLWDREIPLQMLVGMTSDGSDVYVVSAKAENLSFDTTAVTYRPNVLLMTKFDDRGKLVWQRDLNSSEYLGGPERGAYPKAVFSPMTDGTGAVAYAQGKVAVALASNTLPDLGLTPPQRHQRAQYFVVNVDGSGYASAEETSWRHSFDQRLMSDGSDFVFVDLADAGWYMPGAGISLRKLKLSSAGVEFVGPRQGVYVYVRQSDSATQAYPFTSLGDLERGEHGYVALFTSEKSNPTATRDGRLQPIAEPRNVALVHVTKTFDSAMDGAYGTNQQLGNTLIDTSNQPTMIRVTGNVVDSPGPSATFPRPGDPRKTFVQTGIVWLTDLPSGVSAERPKLLKLATDRYLVLWEEWSYQGATAVYRETKAMLVSEYGQVVTRASSIDARLNPSGSDRLFTLDGRAAWLVGGKAGSFKLTLYSVGADLSLSALAIDLPRPKAAGSILPNPLYSGADPQGSSV